MVPATAVAHLDHIAPKCPRPVLDSTHLFRGGDTASVLGQPRPEHIGDLNEHGLLAHGTFALGWGAAELGIATQFRLRVAYLSEGEITVAPGLKGGRTRQPVVDRGCCLAGITDGFGDHPEDGRRAASTKGFHPSAGRAGQTGNMVIYDTRGPTAQRPLDHVEFSPGSGRDLDHRLIGDLATRRVLELGCGGGHAAVGMAMRGARVTAVDPDVTQINLARSLANAKEVAVEFHQALPAELAFVRADQMDLVVSVQSLAFTPDLGRVFRQAHRVLRPGGHMIVSLPHPALLCADSDNLALNARSWLDIGPVGEHYVHTAETVVTSLSRANFGVDTLLEPHSDGPTPNSLIVRARKVGA